MLVLESDQEMEHTVSALFLFLMKRNKSFQTWPSSAL